MSLIVKPIRSVWYETKSNAQEITEESKSTPLIMTVGKCTQPVKKTEGRCE